MDRIEIAQQVKIHDLDIMGIQTARENSATEIGCKVEEYAYIDKGTKQDGQNPKSRGGRAEGS